MSVEHKVVWSEGMFLRPQHFQQQERYLERYAHRRIAALSDLYWGFGELVVDAEALALGSVVVRSAAGVLPDGTPFTLPAEGATDLALEIPANVRDQTVCLALPAARDGAESVIFEESAKSTARFTAHTTEVPDINAVGAGSAEVQTCRTRFRLLLDADVPPGWNALGVVRVAERLANNLVKLDSGYIPPMLNCKAADALDGFIRELAGLLGQRGEALAGRLSVAGRGGVSEIGDFLLLKLVNHWLPFMLHLSELQGVHPERLYAELLRLAGELSVFSNPDRRPTRYAAYRHDDLRGCFHPLMLDLRRALSLVLEQSAIRIDLEERKYGIRMAMISDKSLFKSASFVLAAHANLPADQIQAQFPAQVKIGPVEKIRDLVNLHLPGVRLKPLPIAPRELPYHAGYNYFELDSHHELWRELERSAGLAVHVSGDFPNLDLECWAIRR